MGCGSSMETQSSASGPLPLNGALRLQENGGPKVTVTVTVISQSIVLESWFAYTLCVQNIVQQYVRLDEQISKLEGTCPGPRMATAEAWIEHLQAKRDVMLGLDGMEHNVRPTTTQSQTNRQGEVEAHQLSSYPLTLGSERVGNEIVANTPTKDLAQVSSQ